MNSNMETDNNSEFTGLEIAVIGMAGRFPGARNLDQYWNNLVNKVESITFFTKEELEDAGIDPAEFNHPDYIMAKGVLEDIEYFDAAFFGYFPSEAEIMTPQVRIFHECTWTALEDAGYEPDSYDGQIGVFVGTAQDLFWELLTIQSGKFQDFGAFEAGLLCSHDPLGTRLSYKLNLTGPSFTLYTACSTSGVAIHQACQALLGGECHMALAGAVSIGFPKKRGYLYQEGMINSPDGHCRVFNGESKGTVFGDGIGVVILKLLDDALIDRDHVYAMVRASALNNDGSRKVGYTAPSPEGQSAVMRTALYTAGVEVESVSYVEAHGTGTDIGDTIEGQALKLAYTTDKKGFCGVGSVKGNIGHLNTAAGMSGFIKTVLALKNRIIPPTLHFKYPNPKIDFIDSPFYVVAETTAWASNGYPLRAGVSIFGLGGTNFHAILEEMPALKPAAVEEGREYQLIILSARTQPALEQMSENLATYFKKNPHINLADAAYSLQVGRKTFKYRRMLLASSVKDAADALSLAGDSSSGDSDRVFTAVTEDKKRPVIFMFSDVGAQYVNMGRDLYEKEPVFQEEMDHCFDILNGLVDYDMKKILYPTHPALSGYPSSEGSRGGSPYPPKDCVGSPGQGDHRGSPLQSDHISQPEIAHAVVFIFEYALAKLLSGWGITPETMIGSGLGEFVAACIAGVFSREDALKLVIYRARFLGQITDGLMEKESLFEAFAEQVAQVTLNEPVMSYISGVTGEKINGNDVTHSDYWGHHLRETASFANGVKELLKEPNAVFIVIGPGRQLNSTVEQYLDNSEQRVMNLVGDSAADTVDDAAYLLGKIGLLWLYGITIDWKGFYARETRGRISLPTYPFEKRRYWIEGNPFNLSGTSLIARREKVLRKEANISDWFYAPVWKQVPPRPNINEFNGAGTHTPVRWMVFCDSAGIGARLAVRLKENHQEVVTVKIGTGFNCDEDGNYTLNPCQKSDYKKLITGVCQSGRMLRQVVHLWSVNPDIGREPLTAQTVTRAQDHGLYSLLYLVKALQAENIIESLYMSIITNNMQAVSGEPYLNSEQSTVLGAVNVIPQENPNIRCRSIDIVLPGNKTGFDDLKKLRLVEQLLEELSVNNPGKIVAIRDNRSWVQEYEPMKLDALSSSGKINTGLKEGGIYLLCGGFGAIGLSLAQYLASSLRAKLVLSGRSVFPARDQWDQWLSTHSSTDPVSQRIGKIREMEEAGGKVLTVSADVADEHRMQAVVTQTEETFGPIDGVIHLATISDPVAFNAFALLEKEQFEMHFQGKLWGLLTLQKVLARKKPDFVLIMSSVSSILGGMGLSAYAAANIFMDSFIRQHNREASVPWLGVNWDTWQLEKKRDQNSSLGGSIADLYVNVEEGIESFRRILGQVKQGQVLHSVGNLQARLDQWINLKSLTEETNSSDSHMLELHPRPDLPNPYVPPVNEVQQLIVDTWKKTLGFEQIGIKDDFFALGGDSLKAITVISAMQKQLKAEISIPVFFEDPCIETLAGHIEKSRTTYTPIPLAEKKEYYILSSAQKRLYFIQQLDKESIVYNESQADVLEGPLDHRKIEDIFMQLLERHESYRTSIIVVNEEPVQRIHPTRELDFKIQRLPLPGPAHSLSANQGKHHQQEGVAEVIGNFIQPFDLSRAPFLRVGMMKTGEQKYILVVDRHHIVHDGISSQIFQEDRLALLLGTELPLLKFQYKDYAEWQNSPGEQEKLEKHKAYWLDQFQDEVPVLNLPNDYPRTSFQGFAGDRSRFDIGIEETTALKKLLEQEGVTMFMVTLAIYNVFLAKICRQEDIVVGVPIACRQHADLANIIGLFVNILVLRNHPEEEKTFIEFLSQVKERTLGAFENQAYPFEELVEHVALERDTSRNPLFDVLFQFQNVEVPEVEIPGYTFKLYPVENKVSKFDMTLFVRESGDKLSFILEYSTTLFKEETIQWLNSYFKEIVSAVTSQPNTPLSMIEMIPEEEKSELMDQLMDDLENEG